MVGAIPRLVAEGPGDDARMVLVTLGHPRHALDPLREVPGVVAEGVLEGMGLDVRLGDDVHAQLIGQLEERRVVGVVRGAHAIEAEALHVHHVRAHLVAGHGASPLWVEVVAVDAVDEHPLAVDEQVEAHDLDAAEPDPDGRALDLAAGRVPERQLEVVQPGQLGGPRQHVGHGRGPRGQAVERGREGRVQLRPARLSLGIDRRAGTDAPVAAPGRRGSTCTAHRRRPALRRASADGRARARGGGPRPSSPAWAALPGRRGRAGRACPS